MVIHGECVETTMVTDLAAGTAGEHLVCADLLIRGYRAFLADQNCPYDVAVDLGGRLVRLQVKTTRSPRALLQRAGHYPCYSWGIRRAGKGGRRVYGDDEFDLVGLVALDTREIAYVAFVDCRQTIQIRPTAAPSLAEGAAHGKSCVSCGCSLDQRTAGCKACNGRFSARSGRSLREPVRGKRFSDYSFDRALARMERG